MLVRGISQSLYGIFASRKKDLLKLTGKTGILIVVKQVQGMYLRRGIL